MKKNINFLLTWHLVDLLQPITGYYKAVKMERSFQLIPSFWALVANNKATGIDTRVSQKW